MKTNLLLPVFAALCGFCHAQTTSEFNSMRTPLSPAFTILGVEPTSVEKPNTPSSMAFGLVSNFGSGQLPNNFSMEFSPYWLKARPTLTWRQDTIRTIQQSLARTSTISIATGKYQFEADSVTGVSFGYRVQIFSGKTNVGPMLQLEKKYMGNAARFSALRDSVYKQQLDSLAAIFRQEVLAAGSDTAKLNAARLKYEAGKKGYLELTQRTYFKEYSSEGEDSLVKLATTRTGFILEFAAAGVGASKENNWESMHLPKFALWLTPTYSFDHVSLVSTFRYVHNTFNPDSTQSQFYGGFRCMYSKDRYSISAEGVLRTAGQPITSDDYKVAVVFDYRILDGTWLQVAFGKNFTLPGGQNLLATAGLTYNIADKRYEFD